MYLGVDIGGTKTLVGVFNEAGKIVEQTKFPTPKKYDHFVLEFRNIVAHLKTKEFKAAGVAIPGLLDRKHGRGLMLGNLSWENIPIQADVEKICHCPVVIENDANLGALSEAAELPQHNRLLYLTVSTGLGVGVIQAQKLDSALIDIEAGSMLLPHDNKLVKWESFASGKAISQHFGRRAVDIPASDHKTWRIIARHLSIGIYQLVAIVQPNIIIIGGSVGEYFDRYGELLIKELSKYELPIVPIPPIKQAKRPNEAVIYGCYELAKQKYGHA